MAAAVVAFPLRCCPLIDTGRRPRTMFLLTSVSLALSVHLSLRQPFFPLPFPSPPSSSPARLPLLPPRSSPSNNSAVFSLSVSIPATPRISWFLKHVCVCLMSVFIIFQHIISRKKTHPIFSVSSLFFYHPLFLLICTSLVSHLSSLCLVFVGYSSFLCVSAVKSQWLDRIAVTAKKKRDHHKERKTEWG